MTNPDDRAAIEAMAKALYMQDNDDCPPQWWDRSSKATQSWFCERAAVALDALRAAGFWVGHVNTIFHVVAYDESGYGDNRSRDFTNEDDAVAYARTLAPKFAPVVWKELFVERQRASTRIEHALSPPETPHD